MERNVYRIHEASVLSAIFMPLTFIVGIYGMNFEPVSRCYFDAIAASFSCRKLNLFSM